MTDNIRPSEDELSTWKEIARYLGVSQRTAQNWKKEKGMPVRQFPGERSRVLAFKHELDEWKRKSLVLSEVPGAAPKPGIPDSATTYSWWQKNKIVLQVVFVLIAALVVLLSLWIIRTVLQPPELITIIPNPVPSLNAEQQLIFTGKHFKPGVKIVILPTSTGIPPVSRLEIISTQPTKVTVLANLGRGPSGWIAQVINTDASVSNRLPFSVLPPPSPPPEISGISPDPVIGANIDQLVTFIGQGFESGLTVDVRVYDRTYTLSGAQIVAVTPNRVSVLIKVSSQAAEWTAQVQNLTGATSKPFPFRVVEPTLRRR